MASYLSTVQDCEVGHHFMQYIRRHPSMSKEPEDYLFEVFNPQEEEYVIGNLNDRVTMHGNFLCMCVCACR